MSLDKTCCANDEKTPSIDAAEGAPPLAADLKRIVQHRYANIAAAGCGCGCGGDAAKDYSFVGEDYSQREGYTPDADLGLGCGVPTDLAAIRTGDVVLDLGSGAGIDAFIARRKVGPDGEVLGVDFTPEMVARARENAATLGYTNVRFVLGDIEELPIPQRSVDVVISNCVLNLVPDKSRAFGEMYRVLRPGGHFTVSDIVIRGSMPEELRASVALYAGCVSGAISRDEYLELLSSAGFKDVRISREREISVPADLLEGMAEPEAIEAFRRTGGISSITVQGVRPRRP